MGAHRGRSAPWRRRLLPFVGLVALVAVWDAAVRLSGTRLVPGPYQVVLAVGELAESGRLLRFVVASLYRVTWGYLLAVLIAIPLGLWTGWTRRARQALTPILQIFRPISPLAWIPLAILWFGVGDLPAVFIIFLSTLFPLWLAAVHSVQHVSSVHLNAGRNFGLRRIALVRHVILPATLPQLIVSLRLTLGIAWLVVVAAEMIAVNSGLGFLIIDARNAGNRYDMVIAGMVLIGVIGLGLDILMRRLEELPIAAWGYLEESGETT